MAGGEVMKKAYKSYLKDTFKEYIEFRLSLGFSMRNTNYIYIEFDNFIFEKYPKSKIITQEIIISYLATTKHLHSSSRGYRVTLLRVFCKYLYQQNPRTYIPGPKLIKYGKRKVIPYIFNDNEIKSILRSLKKMPKKNILMETNFVIIGLLYSTGLRVGEISRLNLEDVDLKEKMIFIKRSKFYKSRLVPVSDSVVNILKLYKLKRLGHKRTTNQEDPFFIGMTGNRVFENSISRRFRNVIKSLNLLNDQGVRPRLHDLRHTFATRSLEEIYEKGKNPESFLPALATYLGHVNLTYTQTYLHPTKHTLKIAGEIFNEYSKISNKRKL
jgi:integrase/recombinase XerD